MKKTDAMKEMILVKKLKTEDPVELPMDDIFFDKLHDKIMLSVEKTEVKKLNKLSKTWVFLERKTHAHRSKVRKAAKIGMSAVLIAAGVSLMQIGLELQPGLPLSSDINQSSIISEAKKNPIEWSELAAHYQNESDFYSDIVSQRDISTMVEIDKALSQSL